MNGLKKIAVKSMDKLMLSCDTATMLITKSEYKKLNCIENIQLKMHLLGCKFCRRFKKQSEFISYAIKNDFANLDNKNLKVELSDEQKEKLKEKLKTEQ